MIWRDDDVGAAHRNYAGVSMPGTRLEDLIAVDDCFIRHETLHTIAVMACDLESRPDLVDLIRSRAMVVQLHCWQHDDLTVSMRALNDLERALDVVETLLLVRPTVLYPPWNKTNGYVAERADRLGLTVSVDKISLPQWIRAGGDVDEDTVNFHHWSVPETILLEQALSL